MPIILFFDIMNLSGRKNKKEHLKPMKIDGNKIRPEIFKISAKLSEAGFEAYLVGGAVRDIIFGNEPKDYDILTDAKCVDISRIFRNVVPYGMKHGTVIVVMNKTPYDVTSYNEGDPAPGSLENDLAIRDFTINAMACDLKELDLIDLFGGMEDYSKKEIKCVISPEARFAKDPLRILRAVRQAAKFGFDIETGTFEKAREMSSSILASAPERIMSELVKLFEIKNGRGEKYLRYLTDMNAWHEIFQKYYRSLIQPGCAENFFEFGAGFYDAFRVIADKGYDIKLAFLIIFSLYRVSGNKVTVYEFKKLIKALFDLKFSRPDFDKISALVFLTFYRLHNDSDASTDSRREVKVREMMAEHRELTKQKIDIREIFLLAGTFYEAVSEMENSRKYFEAIKTADVVIKEKDPVYIEDLAINGNDIMPLLGIGAGAKIGEALKYVQRAVIKDKTLNSKEILKELILKKFNTA
ncbi:MAG: hypothetical protein A2008_08630 [Candidatus Wallbacteria bacterium GWC2_49_35]|uniref:Poly A polymerase head domain-containing protein n=1 Tax=Candidatus Wallbacteria bacterium GWC2_49_35 TaxID=1817813 RepID=A0A1F7WMU3_9BACT|nr:MAG: hypothetical protein A2008_08630 [Candidatus Wallbacteria bacterium GWC2_49_35]